MWNHDFKELEIGASGPPSGGWLGEVATLPWPWASVGGTRGEMAFASTVGPFSGLVHERQKVSGSGSREGVGVREVGQHCHATETAGRGESRARDRTGTECTGTPLPKGSCRCIQSLSGLSPCSLLSLLFLLHGSAVPPPSRQLPLCCQKWDPQGSGQTSSARTSNLNRK